MNTLHGKIVVGNKAGRAKFLLSRIREYAGLAEVLRGQPKGIEYERAWRVTATELGDVLSAIEKRDIELNVAAGMMYRWLLRVQEINSELLMRSMPNDGYGLRDLENMVRGEERASVTP